jgi:hypothetical protein
MDTTKDWEYIFYTTFRSSVLFHRLMIVIRLSDMLTWYTSRGRQRLLNFYLFIGPTVKYWTSVERPLLSIGRYTATKDVVYVAFGPRFYHNGQWNRQVSLKFVWRMASSGMLRRVALVRTDVSEELSASFISVTRICEQGKTLAVTSNRRTLRRS